MTLPGSGTVPVVLVLVLVSAATVAENREGLRGNRCHGILRSARGAGRVAAYAGVLIPVNWLPVGMLAFCRFNQ